MGVIPNRLHRRRPPTQSEIDAQRHPERAIGESKDLIRNLKSTTPASPTLLYAIRYTLYAISVRRMGFSPYGPLRKNRTQQAATVRERVTREFARIDTVPKSEIWNMQSEIHFLTPHPKPDSADSVG